MVLCKRKFIQRSMSEEFGEEAEAGETFEYRGQRERGANEDAQYVREEDAINQRAVGSNTAADVAELCGGKGCEDTDTETDTDEETESEEDVRSNYVEVPLVWHPLGFKPCQQFEFQFMEEHDRKWPYAKTPLKQEGKKGVSPLVDQKVEESAQAKTTMQSAAQVLLSLAEILEKDENDSMLMSDTGDRYYPDKRVLQHHRDRKKEYLKKKQAVDKAPNPPLNYPCAPQPFKAVSVSTSNKIDGNPSNDLAQSMRCMTSIGGEEGRIFTLPRANNTCYEIPNQGPWNRYQKLSSRNCDS
eukprot:jgi/Picsp_1/1442/NSC_04921-R1_---NA---